MWKARIQIQIPFRSSPMLNFKSANASYLDILDDNFPSTRDGNRGRCYKRLNIARGLLSTEFTQI